MTTVGSVTQLQSGTTYVPSPIWTPYTQPFTQPRPLRTAYTGGTFDLFHPGHVNFLRKCKSLCDTLVVGLNTDDFVLRYKGRMPFLRYEERVTMLQSCKYVDKVVCNVGNEDSRKAIENSHAKLVIHGDDWTGESYMKQLGVTHGWLDQKAITLVYVPYTPGISTSKLVERIAG